MIVLNKIDGNQVLVNSRYIKSVEEGESTLVTMSVGDQLIVKDTFSDVTELMEAKSYVPEKKERKDDIKKPVKKDKKKPEVPQKDVSHEF